MFALLSLLSMAICIVALPTAAPERRGCWQGTGPIMVTNNATGAVMGYVSTSLNSQGMFTLTQSANTLGGIDCPGLQNFKLTAGGALPYLGAAAWTWDGGSYMSTSDPDASFNWAYLTTSVQTSGGYGPIFANNGINVATGATETAMLTPLWSTQWVRGSPTYGLGEQTAEIKATWTNNDLTTCPMTIAVGGNDGMFILTGNLASYESVAGRPQGSFTAVRFWLPSVEYGRK